MATATSRRAPPSRKVLEQRRELAHELLKINHKHADDYARIAAIEVLLKTVATELGESFKEEFAGEGYVSASGRIEAEFKGNVPQIQTELWLTLPAAERKKLEKSGVVKIEPHWSKASNGRVTVKVLETAK